MSNIEYKNDVGKTCAVARPVPRENIRLFLDAHLSEQVTKKEKHASARTILSHGGLVHQTAEVIHFASVDVLCRTLSVERNLKFHAKHKQTHNTVAAPHAIYCDSIRTVPSMCAYATPVQRRSFV